MVTAREYLRVSEDTSGRSRSLTEQQDDNRRAWPELEFNGAGYSDAAIPASRYSTKRRGGYAELVDDLSRGRLGADVLVLWEASRGSRKVGEWVDLIELSEKHGVRIAVTSDGHIYDPANPRDRKSLLDAATDAEFESAKISTRTRRAMNANAANGRAHGAIPHGYKREYVLDPGAKKRRFVAQVADPDEAPIVVELFERLLAGHSFKSIARDFEARGIVNRSGRPFLAQHLRSIAGRPVYAGTRTHNGERTEGDWPLLAPRHVVIEVQRMIAAPERLTHRPGRAKWLLSGIARCDVCDGPLVVEHRGGRHSYRCHGKRCVMVDREALDTFAAKKMLDYLSQPDNVERLTAEDGDSEALDVARGEVAKLRAELDQLYVDVEAGEVSATIATRSEQGLLARLEATKSRVDELSTPSRLAGLITLGEDVVEHWDVADVEVRRQVARMLLSPDALGELRVTRAPRRGAPVEERVVWRVA